MRGIRLFPIGLMLLSAALVNAQAPAAPAHAPAVPSAAGQAPAAAAHASAVPSAAAPAPADATEAAAPAPPPPPEYPKRPAELPAQPPKVVCHGDQLTISANNSTLLEILEAVRGCTGAKIDIPSGAMGVRSFEQYGPGPAPAVLDQLLNGTPYNYVILSSETNPLKVESVMLTAQGSDTDKAGSLPADLPVTNGRKLWQHMQKFDKPDPSQLNEDGTLIDPDAAAAAVAEAPLPAVKSADPGTSPAAANGAAPAPEASTTAAAEPPAPVAPAVNPNADPSQAVQDRITQMQQMFNQRQQMIKQQNQPPSPTPNN